MSLMRVLRRTAAMAAFGSALAFAGSAMAETYRLAHHHAVGGTVDQLAGKFAELVDQKSDGRITIQVFPAGQLGQEREAFDLLNQGAIDFTITSTGMLDGVYPPIAVTSLPFIFRSWDHAMNAYHGEFGDKIRAGVRAGSDTEILSYVGLGFRDMLFRGDPVTKVEDMQGLKMRSPESAVWIRMYELLGAKPTPVTWGEVYTAMQTGVASGLDSPAQAALDMKFEEVTSSIVRTAQMFGAMSVNMNKEEFDKLAPSDQALVMAAALEATTWADETISIPGEQAAYGIMQERGMKVVSADDIDAWAEAMRPLWEEVAAQAPGADELILLLVNAK